MYPTRLILSLVAAAFWALPTLGDGASYFMFDVPNTGTQWVNGIANPLRWSKGLLDGVNSMDVELARLSTDGLLKVALNVPANNGNLNIFLTDVPAADDYYLLFLNSTHGVMYGISPRFTILAQGATSANSTSPIASAATVTVSGSPNPTQGFATTFPAIANGALAWRLSQESNAQFVGILSAMFACLLGAAWTVL